MKRARRLQGKGAFDLIEEATHGLRTAPVTTLAVYYLGAVPFVLGLLYFWADMSRSPFASQHLADSALGLTGLFLWMKFWQVIFARRLRAHIAAEPVPHWNVRRCGRVVVVQTFLQAWGLVPLAVLTLGGYVFLPVALVLSPLMAWLLTLFQNVTALTDGQSADTKAVLRKAWRLWLLWPRQNIIILLVMTGFGFYVFLNWAVVCLSLPYLIKMLFGIESVFTRDTFSLLNTTFFAGMAGLTYLCVDPILKTIYVLRCFYGESLESGEDLRAELNSFAAASPAPAALLALLLGLVCALPARAADTPSPAPPPAGAPVASPVSPADLDRAINQTIHENKYTWRMPREKVVEPDASDSAITRFFDKAGKMLRKWARAVLDWLDKWWRKLFPHRRTVSTSGSDGYGWIMALQILLYGLGTVALVALAVLLYRAWRDRQSPAAVAGEPIQPVPDLADESVRADQLPEDGWTKLARELLERAEFRLAMRAFYLASLSHLAARNLIRIARFKSNRDYERELRRRGHAFPGLLSVFGDNLLSFECIWYGTHEVNRGLVDRFAADVERLKAAG
jgi:hypothetical protein